MSRENVETVRRSTEAFLGGDVDGALAAFHPDVVVDARVRPEGHVYHGRDGLVEAMRVWIGAWEDSQLEMLDYGDAGDKVVGFGRESGQGFLDRDQALEAAGCGSRSLRVAS
jgi:hypothetical protein